MSQQSIGSHRPPLVPGPFTAGVERALAHPPGGVDPWYGNLRTLATASGRRTFARAHHQLVSLIGGVSGRDVVDAGSGFGLTSMLLAHWGARRIYSLEQLDGAARWQRALLSRDFTHLRHVHALRSDASAMPLRAASVDVVLSIEAVSHYFDVDGFLDETRRVLRPGGALLISDGNNGANPRIRRRTEAIWGRWERGPEGTIGDHDVREPFVARRERLIRERFPDLTADAVVAYAADTVGFDRGEIEAAILAHRRGGPRPRSREARGLPPRDPENGSVVERLFDPRQLADRLARRGFAVRALPHYGGARNDLLLAANLVLRRLPTFRLARAFRIVATRR